MEPRIFKNCSYFVVVFSLLFFVGCGKSDDTISETKTITSKVTQHLTSDSGEEHLTGAAQIDYNSDKGSWSMESTADDYHYRDKTTFHKDGQTWTTQSESIGE